MNFREMEGNKICEESIWRELHSVSLTYFDAFYKQQLKEKKKKKERKLNQQHSNMSCFPLFEKVKFLPEPNA